MKLPGGWLTPQRLLRVGVALWLLSLLTPDARGHAVGAVWLAYGRVYGARLLVRGFGAEGSWSNVVTGAALLAGFAANLAVLVPLGIAGRLICLVLPWLPYLAYWALWHSGQVARAASPATLLYFYPWVLGLTLIQTAQLWRLGRARPGA